MDCKYKNKGLFNYQEMMKKAKQNRKKGNRELR